MKLKRGGTKGPAAKTITRQKGPSKFAELKGRGQQVQKEGGVENPVRDVKLI